MFECSEMTASILFIPSSTTFFQRWCSILKTNRNLYKYKFVSTTATPTTTAADRQQQLAA